MFYLGHIAHHFSLFLNFYIKYALVVASSRIKSQIYRQLIGHSIFLSHFNNLTSIFYNCVLHYILLT